MKTINLKQQAYCDYSHKYQCAEYTAHGVMAEDEDEEVKVFWDIIDSECEDESNACNWNKFEVTDAGSNYLGNEKDFILVDNF